MKISDRNSIKIGKLYLFCILYVAHRDFDLAKKISKGTPLNWSQAESLSNFCNQIISTKSSKPQDFISNENENADKVIDKYLILKNCLTRIKNVLGTSGKNELYRSVKSFYRKKTYCYQMDSFYTFLMTGLFLYVTKMISYSDFLNTYCFEVSLFTGKKSPINLRNAIKISNHILKC